MERAPHTPMLDVDFVRSQFPAFSAPTLLGQAFFENAGGSYACGAVIDRLGEYYRRLKVQPYYQFAASVEAGEWMDAARGRLAEKAPPVERTLREKPGLVAGIAVALVVLLIATSRKRKKKTT